MRTLCMFAKHWQPGEVKTRLAADIGAEQAADIYRRCVRLLLVRLAACGDRRSLFFSPSRRRDAFSHLLADSAGGAAWTLKPQHSGDLGQRMQACLQATLGADDRVVLIGSDSPTLTAGLLERAFEQLEDRPVVLGPTLDGGYYLVGVRTLVPPIFDRIDWGSETVFSDTVARLDAEQIPYATLPPGYDIDTVGDLSRLATDLAQQVAGHCPEEPIGCEDHAQRQAAAALLEAIGPYCRPPTC